MGFVLVRYLRDAEGVETLSSSQKFVLLTLGDWLNDESMVGYRSYAGLTRDCNLARRNVINAVRKLEEDGWLAVTRVGPGRSLANEYSLGEKVSERYLLHRKGVAPTPGVVSERHQGGVGATPEKVSERHHKTPVTPLNTKLNPKESEEIQNIFSFPHPVVRDAHRSGTLTPATAMAWLNNGLVTVSDFETHDATCTCPHRFLGPPGA